MKAIYFSKVFTFICIITLTNISLFAQSSKRKIISLNGTWQIAQGDSIHIPEKFNHIVQVPGLVSLAVPAFKNVAPEVLNPRRNEVQPDSLRESFWYRRTFTLRGPIPDVAVLKIAKAKYGTKVFLNGKEIDVHLPCFTPGYFNVKEALKVEGNELIVRVGASRLSVPYSIPDGFDYEKERYIPGIYDNVKLILSGSPHILRVQTIPNIIDKELQVQLTLDIINRQTADVSFIIKEAESQKISGTLDSTFNLSDLDKDKIINVRIPLQNCHLWSPKDPFLYRLIVKTDGDEKEVKFGMREFHFNPLTKKAVLNGKPYFMRGSNITLYRFFEDSASGSLPWDTTWVRNLFKSFNQFHWNSLRFCIGFPPNFWYDIADEEGFLIQNEFPIWYKGHHRFDWPKGLKADELVKEFTEMIWEYWNHPSVVIWDASNETAIKKDKTDEIGKAVWMVRNLDLSNRPWDNSYSGHRATGDAFESHPYFFIDRDFKFKYIANTNPVPKGSIHENLENFPVIINEYGWLWLNRDGTPTALTQKVYENILGPNSAAEERWHIYATYLAAETEFWRCHRKAAGVLCFTALGYSRPDGATSDFFSSVRDLEYNSTILKYLPDAFSPVGLMLDEWGNEIECNKPHSFKILAINDLGKDWNGEVQLQILNNNKTIIQKSEPLSIPAYGQKPMTIHCTTPDSSGKYTVKGVLLKDGEKPVKSIREIPFVKKGH